MAVASIGVRIGLGSLGIMALALLAMTQVQVQAQAQTVASVSLQPAAVNLAPDETVTLDVVVDNNVRSLYGAQFQLAFNAATLQVVDASQDVAGGQVMAGPLLAAEMLETTGPDFVVARNQADNRRGKIEFTIAQLNPSPPVDQGGVLARVTFQAVSSGHSDLSLADVLLSNREGQRIPASILGGGIDVVMPETAEAPKPAVAQPEPEPAQPEPAVAQLEPEPAVAQPEPEPVEPEAAPATIPAGGPLNTLLIAIIGATVGVLAIGIVGFLMLRHRANPGAT